MAATSRTTAVVDFQQGYLNPEQISSGLVDFEESNCMSSTSSKKMVEQQQQQQQGPPQPPQLPPNPAPTRGGDLRAQLEQAAQDIAEDQERLAEEIKEYASQTPWKSALWFCLPMAILSIFGLILSLLGTRSYLNAHPELHITGANCADLLSVTGPDATDAGRWFVFFMFSVGCGICWLIILPMWVWEFGRKELKWRMLEERL